MDQLRQGVEYLGQSQYWLALSAGLVLAIAGHLVPGLGTPFLMAIAIPFLILKVPDPVVGTTVLMALVGGGNNVESIPALVAGYASAESQVTFLEGHRLVRRGLAAETLGAVYSVSMLGGVIGAIAMALMIPILKPFILHFRYPEIAAMALFGVAMVSALSRGAMLKGITAGLFGILIGTIGVAPVTGVPRFDFGRIELWDGTNLVATTLGLFAMPEMLDLVAGRQAIFSGEAGVSRKDMLRGAKIGFGKWPMVIRQSLYGVFLGAVPGVGSATIDWLAYAFGIALSKDKSQFGTEEGSLDGVLFSESAQNAKTGGQAVPSLALGIPGGLTWAFIIGAMISYGIAPGPNLLSTKAYFTIATVLTIGLSNVVITGVGLAITPQLAQLTKIPFPAVGAVTIPMALLTTYMYMTSWLAIPIVLGFTIIGIIMKAYGWPRPPVILGFILGGVIEGNLMTSLSIFGPIGMMTRPITIVLFIVTVAAVVYFQKAMGTGSKTEEPTGSAPAGGAGAMRRPRLVFNWKQTQIIPTLLMAGGAGAFIYVAHGYRSQTSFLPTYTSIGIIVMCAMLLFRQLTIPPSKTQIMDIALRTVGEGALKAWAGLVGIILFFLVMSMGVGMNWAGIFMAPIIVITYLQAPLQRRLIIAAITILLMVVFVYGVLDGFIGVQWPHPVFQTWATGG